MNEQEIYVEPEAITVSSGAVNSVNGYTGDVVLTTEDIENTSDYQNGTEVENAINEAIQGKQDTLIAGDNISIEGNTISATGSTYTAGEGLNLNNNEFSADTSVLATQADLSAKANSADLATVATSGSYDDLTNKPTIPTVNDATLTVTQNGTSVGTFTANDADNTTIALTDTTYTAGNGLSLSNGEFSADTSILATQTDLNSKQDTLTAGDNITITNDTISATDTTYSDFTGTDGTAAGTNGLVPAPATTDANKFLKSDGTWGEAGGGGGSYTTLTSADYNYPANNPTGIAPWLLDTGLYKIDTEGASNLKIWLSRTSGGNFANGRSIFVLNVAASASDEYKLVMMSSELYATQQYTVRMYNYLGNILTSYQAEGTLLTSGNVINNLNSSSSSNVLSANQGRVLNEKIDAAIINGGTTAPTTSTKGSVGTLYSYVDSGTGYLYICTAVEGSTYTWTQLTTT